MALEDLAGRLRLYPEQECCHTTPDCCEFAGLVEAGFVPADYSGRDWKQTTVLRFIAGAPTKTAERNLALGACEDLSRFFAVRQAPPVKGKGEQVWSCQFRQFIDRPRALDGCPALRICSR